MSERNEYDEHNGQTEVAEQSRPEYVDFTVDDFPGGLAAGLEAILMVADQPQTVEDMARVLVVDEGDVEDALQALRAEYEGDAARGIRPRGFELRHTARGWQFANRAEFEPVVSAFVTDGQTALLVTSEFFLDQMGLNSLDELPSLAPFLPSVAEMTRPGESDEEPVS